MHTLYLETEGFQTFLQGTRGKPRGNACGYYIIKRTSARDGARDSSKDVVHRLFVIAQN